MVQSWNKENGKMSRRTLMKTLGLTGAAVLSGGLTGGLMHSIRADSNSESDAGGRLDQIEEKLVHISDALERCPLDLHAFESYVQNDDWTVSFKHAFEQLRDEGFYIYLREHILSAARWSYMKILRLSQRPTP